MEPISKDPKSPDFMAFRIVKTNLKKNKERELSRFRAENIIHMRNFMASMGGRGTGLFSSSDDSEVPVELSQGKWDSNPDDQTDFAVAAMTTAKAVFSSPADGKIQSYHDAISQLPTAFYYNQVTGLMLAHGVKEASFPGPVLPLYDAKAPIPRMLRRPIQDSFRPPLGHPIEHLKSIGYGEEVGLRKGLQQIYDPCTQKNIILDHTELKIITDDICAKPGLSRSEVKPVVVEFGDLVDENMPTHICRQEQIVKEACSRARSKPVGCTLSAHGQDGLPGESGSMGDKGKNGSDGSSGLSAERSGEAGGDGGDGGKGEGGEDAHRGGDVILVLSGSAKELCVSGSKEFQCSLGGEGAEEVLLVDCHGGNGGAGGDGGDGGTGGEGGKGGSGIRGRTGDRGHGGAGGNGGDAGDGGRGGDGGDGGAAGNGGNCVIQATDAALLMLVEVDCSSGKPGDGGKGGQGGRAGKPGRGGRGGEGGRDGNRGKPGKSKGSGSNGSRGKTARNGGLLWVVWSDIHVYESNTRYDVLVENLTVLPALNGGIFEPNERITVCGVLVRNTGGLTLPPGATVFIPSTESVKFEPCRFEIPNDALKPSQRYVIPFEFEGRIYDIPPPNKPGRGNYTAEFCTRVELLGRPFEKSFLRQKLNVRYPVQLGSPCNRDNMGRGEITTLMVVVNNISGLPYGSCKHSGGKVVLHLHFDSRLLPVGVASDGTKVPYEVTYDPRIQDSMYVELFEIPPGDKVCVSVVVQMESRAELFHRCHWQVDLYLRGKLIEYNQQCVRVTPAYDVQKPPADLLLITSTVITRREFVFWQHVLELLDISVDFWDTTRYHGLSVDSRTGKPHEHSWRGRYTRRMILYPHCNLNLLHGEDIAEHFHGKKFRDGNLQELGSSFVAFMPKLTSGHTRESTMRHLSMANPAIEQPGKPYGGRHLFKPSAHADTPAYIRWEREFIKKLEKENPAQSQLLLARQVNVTSVGCCNYTYGSVDIRQVPILKSSKFLEVDGMGGNMANMSFDDAKLSPTSTNIPLASKYGQVFLSTLYGLPVYAKLNLMKKHDPQASDVLFYLPNKSVMSRAELAMITLAWEIADELFSSSGRALRMQELYNDIKDHVDAYLKCGRVILRGLRLIKEETKKRKSRLSTSEVKQAYRTIKDSCKQVRSTLEGRGVESSKLENMLSLDFLQDQSRVHRCHQHFMGENRWNLIDITGKCNFDCV